MKKQYKIIFIIVTTLLLIPLLAMQFTNEVNWSLMDFILAGLLLLVTGFACNFVLQNIKNTKIRIGICIFILIVFLVFWAELAVGILDNLT